MPMDRVSSGPLLVRSSGRNNLALQGLMVLEPDIRSRAPGWRSSYPSLRRMTLAAAKLMSRLS